MEGGPRDCCSQKEVYLFQSPLHVSRDLLSGKWEMGNGKYVEHLATSTTRRLPPPLSTLSHSSLRKRLLLAATHQDLLQVLRELGQATWPTKQKKQPPARSPEQDEGLIVGPAAVPSPLFPLKQERNRHGHHQPTTTSLLLSRSHRYNNAHHLKTTPLDNAKNHKKKKTST